MIALLNTLRRFVKITRSSGIMRRYFVVNGFDGALTMLGLTMGFRIAGDIDVSAAITVCLGAAIALAASGVSSAYVSESAERQKELRDLERAMMVDLSRAAHGTAARFVPVLVAITNGLGPLLVSLAVIFPLWLDDLGVPLPWAALDTAVGTAFAVIFLLGVLLGRISGRFWLWSGIRALALGLVTAALIATVAA